MSTKHCWYPLKDAKHTSEVWSLIARLVWRLHCSRRCSRCIAWVQCRWLGPFLPQISQHDGRSARMSDLGELGHLLRNLLLLCRTLGICTVHHIGLWLLRKHLLSNWKLHTLRLFHSICVCYEKLTYLLTDTAFHGNFSAKPGLEESVPHLPVLKHDRSQTSKFSWDKPKLSISTSTQSTKSSSNVP